MKSTTYNGDPKRGKRLEAERTYHAPDPDRYTENLAASQLQIDAHIVTGAEEMASITAEIDRIFTIAQGLPATFAATLNAHVKRLNYSDKDVAERSGVSDRRVWTLRHVEGQQPTLETAMALVLGLNLHPIFAYDLIAKAQINLFACSKQLYMYRYLIDYHHKDTLAVCNQRLIEAGIDQQFPSNRKRDCV